jgi:hypothetical protein
MAAAPEPLRLFETATRDGREESRPETAQAGLLGGSLQAVAEAGRLVTRAQARFATAVISARRAGSSWRLIGTAAGVPYQSLHRRFAGHPLSDVRVRDSRDA